MVYNAWNTCVKLVWRVPRSTHTYIVDNLLATTFQSVKQQLIGRYINFTRKLAKSRSPEVSTAFSIVSRCIRSTTGKNLHQIERDVLLDPWLEPAWKIQQSVMKRAVPDNEGWRIQYLRKLLDARLELESTCDDYEELTNLIDSLCSS